MIPSNREIALTKAIERLRDVERITGDIAGEGATLSYADAFLKFLDGPAPEDEITALQRRATLREKLAHPFPHEVTE